MKRPEILLIEDEPDAREALSLLLEHHGYDVRCAEDGAQALQAAEQRAPDLIITDLSMPGMTGLELLARFRALPELADVPVIVVSAHHQVETRIAGFDLGADDFLGKPVDVDDLLARIRRQLVRSGRQHAVVRQSMVDELTGVLNRRGIANFYARELERTRSNDGTVAVMLIDLNDFKNVNDAWGHATGDTMLCAVARGLQDALRATDRVARMGGDEFAIVLPDIGRDGSEALAQRVRQVSPVVLELSPDSTVRVGLSFGIASAAANEVFEDVLARADAAMYEDKRRQKLASEVLTRL